jgi:hypothetical protein
MTSKPTTAKPPLTHSERRMISDRRAGSLRAKKSIEAALADLDKAFETYEGAKGRGVLTHALEREIMTLLKRARKAVDDAIIAWAGRSR